MTDLFSTFLPGPEGGDEEQFRKHVIESLDLASKYTVGVSRETAFMLLGANSHIIRESRKVRQDIVKRIRLLFKEREHFIEHEVMIQRTALSGWTGSKLYGGTLSPRASGALAVLRGLRGARQSAELAISRLSFAVMRAFEEDGDAEWIDENGIPWVGVEVLGINRRGFPGKFTN